MLRKARMYRSLKQFSHVFYLLLLSYVIIQRWEKVLVIKKIDRFLVDLKHILIWTKFQGIQSEGQTYFIEKRCRVLNCYLTKNRTLFGDTRYFDAVVFDAESVSKGSGDLPSKRASTQKFIFASAGSSDTFPVCDPNYEDFFNWTFTYKVDSTIVYRFVLIYNLDGDELPTGFRWLKPKDMQPLNSYQRNKLHSKSKAAAILLDQCESRSHREDYIKKLNTELAEFDLSVDVFGECGIKCKRKTMAPCNWRFRRDYYFYLAFEDSISKDYMTDLVLNAYKNDAVPIVFGGADYEKFLPPGSYINALRMDAYSLAKTISDITQNRAIYYEFFRWKNHYNIQEGRVLDACALCEILNKPTWLQHKTSFKQFRKWWNADYVSRCKESSAFNFL